MFKYINILSKQIGSASTQLASLQTKRTFSISLWLPKKYKYALNFGKNKPSISSGIRRREKQNSVLVNGTLLNFFDLGHEESERYSFEDSPKQNAYGEIVKTAIDSLFSSTELPEPLCSGVIEVVKVEVASSLCTAVVIWKLPEHLQKLHTKVEVEKALEVNLKQIRFLLPAHSTVTQTPLVSFLYDKFTEQQETIDKLFEKVRSEFSDQNNIP